CCRSQRRPTLGRPPGACRQCRRCSRSCRRCSSTSRRSLLHAPFQHIARVEPNVGSHTHRYLGVLLAVAASGHHGRSVALAALPSPCSLQSRSLTAGGHLCIRLCIRPSPKVTQNPEQKPPTRIAPSPTHCAALTSSRCLSD